MYCFYGSRLKKFSHLNYVYACILNLSKSVLAERGRNYEKVDCFNVSYGNVHRICNSCNGW